MKTQTKTVDYPFESDPWEPGTIIFGRRAHWRVVEVHEVTSRVWPWRWRYTVVPLGAYEGEPPADAARVDCYRRGEGPEDFFGPPPAGNGGDTP